MSAYRALTGLRPSRTWTGSPFTGLVPPESGGRLTRCASERSCVARPDIGKVEPEMVEPQMALEPDGWSYRNEQRFRRDEHGAPGLQVPGADRAGRGGRFRRHRARPSRAVSRKVRLGMKPWRWPATASRDFWRVSPSRASPSRWSRSPPMPLRSGWKWQRRSRREGPSAVASPATAHRRAETPWFRGTPADGQPSLPGSPRSARKAGARSHACSRVETGHAGGHSPAGGSDGRGATGSSLSALPGWNKAAPRPSVAHRGRRGGDRALVAGSRAEVRERQDTGAIPDWISTVNLLANVAAAGLLDTVSAAHA